jgi:prepilin-type N-terminal cleavage/methylation domain-containing protein
MRKTRAISQAAPRRSGFTIMELIVAIVILSIGILGLAASSGIVMRMIGGGTHQTIAATVAQTRFESLRSLSCGRITSGSSSSRNVQESWSVTPVGPVAAPRAMDVRLSVTYQVLVRSGSSTTRTQNFRSEILCV